MDNGEVLGFRVSRLYMDNGRENGKYYIVIGKILGFVGNKGIVYLIL